jgi:hypothetical protein
LTGTFYNCCSICGWIQMFETDTMVRAAKEDAGNSIWKHLACILLIALKNFD